MTALSRRLQDYFWRDPRVSDADVAERGGAGTALRSQAHRSMSERDRAGACGLAAVAVALSVRQVDDH
jgi:hypothetical protein